LTTGIGAHDELLFFGWQHSRAKWPIFSHLRHGKCWQEITVVAWWQPAVVVGYEHG
jgi:hypothetical protein